MRNATGTTATLAAVLIALSVWSVAVDFRRRSQTSYREMNDATYVVDLNLATEAELRLLPGVGEKLALAILGDREAHGSFETVEDLTRIPGIKTGRLEQLRPFITVSASRDGAE